MQITFSPQRCGDALAISKQGEALTINDEVFDFSTIPEGATLPVSAINCKFFCGDVERVGGKLHITLLLPHGPDPSQAVAFPEPIIDPEDGPLELPK